MLKKIMNYQKYYENTKKLLKLNKSEGASNFH